MRVLGVSGSLRRDSYNTALLRAAVPFAPGGTELVLWEALAAVPAFNEDLEDDVPDAVRGWREAIEAADAVLFATPEYNGSIPGQLKNAVDWASRPFEAAALHGKPVAVVGASTSAYGALWAQAELRKALGLAGARVVDAELAIPHAHDRFDGTRLAVAPAQERRLTEVLAALAGAATPAVAA